MKTILYFMQYLLFLPVIILLRALPADKASDFLGKILRFIGPYMPLSRIAHVNLAIAFPLKSKMERKKILAQCWENLGRTLAESLHIATLRQNTSSGPGWRIEGEEHLYTARESGRPIIFFSGHLGNWELMPAIVARYDLGFASFYRAPNNPFIHKILCQIRQQALTNSSLGKKAGCDIPPPLFAKGAKGAKEALRHLARGGNLGILGDQKMNDGIELRFFNRPTMVAPAAASLALRYNALIITGYTWREGPARLVLRVNPPLDPQKDLHYDNNSPSATMTRQSQIPLLMQQLTTQLQSWIEKQPGLWLWLHRRWEKSLYRRPEISIPDKNKDSSESFR